MSMGKGLRFRGFVVPESELVWSFDTSGGPGGQHANKASSRARLDFDIASSSTLPAAIRDRLIAGTNARAGVVTVTVDDTRSQWRNRAIARQRLAEKLDHALQTRRVRRRTAPSGTARRVRLKEKRRRGEIKRLRRRPTSDD